MNSGSCIYTDANVTDQYHSGNHNIDIYDNVCSDDWTGIYVGTEGDANTTNINVYNNLIYNIARQQLGMGRTNTGTGTFTNIAFYKNTCIAGPEGYSFLQQVPKAAMNGITIVGNIFARFVPSVLALIAGNQRPVPFVATKVDNNLFWNNGNAVGVTGTNATSVNPMFETKEYGGLLGKTDYGLSARSPARSKIATPLRKVDLAKATVNAPDSLGAVID